MHDPTCPFGNMHVAMLAAEVLSCGAMALAASMQVLAHSPVMTSAAALARSQAFACGKVTPCSDPGFVEIGQTGRKVGGSGISSSLNT